MAPKSAPEPFWCRLTDKFYQWGPSSLSVDWQKMGRLAFFLSAEMQILPAGALFLAVASELLTSRVDFGLGQVPFRAWGVPLCSRSHTQHTLPGLQASLRACELNPAGMNPAARNAPLRVEKGCALTFSQQSNDSQPLELGLPAPRKSTTAPRGRGMMKTPRRGL